MAQSSQIITFLQHRSPLSTETYLIPISLRESELSQSITSLASHILTTFSDKRPLFQQRNYRSLIRKITNLAQLLEPITDSGNHNQTTSTGTCLTEIYVLLNRAMNLLNSCLEYSRIELLISSSMISIYFRDLDREILCILDVIPWVNMNLNDDGYDLVKLMKDQLGKGKIYIDPFEESLRSKIFGYYESLKAGEVPEYTDVYKYFVEDFGITDEKTWIDEIKYLEDMISRPQKELYVPSFVLRGFLALMRYSRLLIIHAQEESITDIEHNNLKQNQDNQMGKYNIIPEEFLCPISHDLMKDAVTLTTGQTFDRATIEDWLRRGQSSCPVTRTVLTDLTLVPNKAVQSQISKYCASKGIPYKPPSESETQEEHRRNNNENSSNKAVLEATKATVKLILEIFIWGVERARYLAVAELRLIMESENEIWIDILNAENVPFFVKHLKSDGDGTQESCAIILANISLHARHKITIIHTPRILQTLLEVVQSSKTDTSRLYAMRTIHCLSKVPENKRKIAKVKGLLETYSGILTNGSLQCKIRAMQTLKKLCTFENRILLIKAGIVKAAVNVMKTVQGIKNIAADVLAILVTMPKGAKKIRREKTAVKILIYVLVFGNPTEKKSAAETLIAFLNHGESKAMRRYFQNPHIRDLITDLLQSEMSEELTTAAQFLLLREDMELEH